jgi:hypothetical protein
LFLPLLIKLPLPLKKQLFWRLVILKSVYRRELVLMIVNKQYYLMLYFETPDLVHFTIISKLPSLGGSAIGLGLITSATVILILCIPAGRSCKNRK